MPCCISMFVQFPPELLLEHIFMSMHLRYGLRGPMSFPRAPLSSVRDNIIRDRPIHSEPILTDTDSNRF